MILSGYFDESGTHADSEVVTVAGYLAEQDQWISFEIEWKAALAEYELPYFHMTDFANGAPPYYHTWTKEEKESRFTRLVDIINRHALFSVGFCIGVRKYKALFSQKAQKVAGGIYGVAANCCFMDIGAFVRENYPDARVRYIFETGAEGSGEVLRTFNKNLRYQRNKERYRLLSLSFEDKREYCPLQASDILAYELYRYLPQKLGLDPGKTIRREISQLQGVPKRWFNLDDQTLANHSEVMEAFAEFDKLPHKEKRKWWQLSRKE